MGTNIPMVKDPRAKVVRKETWGSYFLLSLESPTISSQAQPGQFLMIKTSSQTYPLLRRPFSIHQAGDSRLQVFFERCGTGTALLSEKQAGDELDLLGPLGKGFRLEGSKPDQAVALIGGGRGIAPLYFLADRLREHGVSPTVYYGGKTSRDLPLKEKFKTAGFELRCSTDDGSLGHHGFVTACVEKALARSKPQALFACGPDPMLRRVAEIAIAESIPTQLSLESIMGCGFGACWGCVKMVRSKDGNDWTKTCEAGPVFTAEEIVWRSGD